MLALADVAEEPDASYQAVGLSYGEDPNDVQDSVKADLFYPGFPVPTEHQHAMRGMTEQQHYVSDTHLEHIIRMLPTETPSHVCASRPHIVSCLSRTGASGPHTVISRKWR